MTQPYLPALTAAGAIAALRAAPAIAADSIVPDDFASIQAAIDDAGTVNGDTITVRDGTYLGNVTISKEITLVSENGRATTTIEGISFLGALGAIVVPPGVNNVRIEGFTIKGIDNGAPGVENAAVYFRGAHSGIDVIDNEVMAIGDHGLLTEYNAVISDFLIDGNIFSGSTFFDPPAGDGFSQQFTLPNVPRQLVVMGGGSGGTNGSDVTFTNNQVSGTAGGFNSAGDPQGNNLVTIDVDSSTISGNAITGTTSRFATSLRARRPSTSITGNTFTRTGLLPFAGFVFRQNGDVTLGALAAANTFDGELFFSPSAGATDGTIFPISALRLEISDCPDDADGAAGYQIAVRVWMRGLTGLATGFQAFIEFDDAVFNYRGDLSSYSAGPFPNHVQDIVTANVATGEIRIDGGDDFGDPGVQVDALLATLVFDVVVDCSSVSVDFDLDEGFDSELSFDGDPIPTLLVNTQSFVVDDTPPLLDPCPANITVAADANVGDGCVSAIVTFDTPGATDDCDASPTVVCSPPSGTAFPAGATTTVTCTATDDCGNESTCMFDVTVTLTNVVQVEVDLIGVDTESPAVSRCIRFVTDSCGNTTDVVLSFVDHDANDATPIRATADIEVGCGDWSSLCAKDLAHTQWFNTPLSLSGPVYTATTVIALTAGDNDNDGDVDINDLTLLIAQFGGPEPAGGCPWDGTRGADFDNNGNVGTEDYSLLSANWLTTSSCACAVRYPHSTLADPRTSLPVRELDESIAQRVDFNRDGVFDVADVRIFEAMHGLPPALSSRMADIGAAGGRLRR